MHFKQQFELELREEINKIGPREIAEDAVFVREDT